MKGPDQRLFEADTQGAAFLAGACKGLWGFGDSKLLPDGLVWPKVVLWMAAANRSGAPERFHVLLDLSDYRNVPPTGTFWNPTTKNTLDFASRPKGASNSRFAKVFRTDWREGVAFYHPYDRLAASTHADWPEQLPHLIWDSEHTIVDYLEEFSSLLHCQDYTGV